MLIFRISNMNAVQRAATARISIIETITAVTIIAHCSDFVVLSYVSLQPVLQSSTSKYDNKSIGSLLRRLFFIMEYRR